MTLNKMSKEASCHLQKDMDVETIDCRDEGCPQLVLRYTIFPILTYFLLLVAKVSSRHLFALME